MAITKEQAIKYMIRNYRVYKETFMNTKKEKELTPDTYKLLMDMDSLTKDLINARDEIVRLKAIINENNKQIQEAKDIFNDILNLENDANEY